MIFGEYLMFFVKNLFICKENRNLFCAIFVAFYSAFYYRISRFFLLFLCLYAFFFSIIPFNWFVSPIFALFFRLCSKQVVFTA